MLKTARVFATPSRVKVNVRSINSIKRVPPSFKSQSLTSRPKFIPVQRRSYFNEMAAKSSGIGLSPYLWGAALVGGGFLLMNTLNQPVQVGFGDVLQHQGAQVVPRKAKHSISPYVQSYLYDTFKYVALGLGITVVSAILAFRSGLPLRLFMSHPIASSIGLSVALIGMMVFTRAIDPANAIVKNLSFTAFNVLMGVSLCTMGFFAPQILFKAGLYTAGLVSALSLTAMNAKEDRFLFLGGPLLAGLSVIFLSSIVGLFLPATMTTALSLIDGLWLYGGLAIFGGLVLYDTQRVMEHARNREHLSPNALAQIGPPDHIAESLGIYLNIINIFIRLVYILQSSNNRRK
jgi:FtsH-binding integral membrane protein